MPGWTKSSRHSCALLSPPERNNRAYFFLFPFFFQYQYQWSYGLLIGFFAGLGFGRLCSASSCVAKRRLRRTWMPPPLSVKRTKNSPPEQRLISTLRMVRFDSMIYALSPTLMGMITSLLSYDISIATFFGHDKVKAKTPDHFLAESSFLFLGLEFFLFAQANHFPNLLIFRSGFVPGLFEVGIHFSQQLYRFWNIYRSKWHIWFPFIRFDIQL